MERIMQIGPYRLFKRTEYSKLRVLDINDKDITDEKIGKDLIESYKDQNLNKDKYFKILDEIITGLSDDFPDDINYLFIPEGIKVINDYVLSKKKFEFVFLPDSVQLIGKGVFSNCNELKHIEIPDSILYIDTNAFEDCRQLKNVKLSKNIKSINSRVFFNCCKLEYIYIPNQVKEIGEYAFYGCTNLKEIVVPDCLEKINGSAFDSCKSLKEINLPESLKHIGLDSFRNCKSLEEITIPNSISKIGKHALAHCTNLKKVVLPEKLEIMPQDLFYSCPNLESITLPDNVKEIQHRCFSGTENIENINIPKNLQIILNYPFIISKIKSLTFNYDLNGLTAIEYDGKDRDLISESAINKLIISNTVKYITPNVFKISGNQIKTIDYKGTKEQFEEFKENNEELFKNLPNLEEINFNEKEREFKNIENISIEK